MIVDDFPIKHPQKIQHPFLHLCFRQLIQLGYDVIVQLQRFLGVLTPIQSSWITMKY